VIKAEAAAADTLAAAITADEAAAGTIATGKAAAAT
jgi:hypothetical protein